MYFNLTFVSQFLWEGMFVGETMRCTFVGETMNTPLCVCGEKHAHSTVCLWEKTCTLHCVFVGKKTCTLHCVFVGETMHTPLCVCGRNHVHSAVCLWEKPCTLCCVFVGETMHCVLIVSMKQSSPFQQWPPACLIEACRPCLHMVPPTLKLFLSVSLMLLCH